MRTPHTGFHKGTPVLVILRDGTAFRDKFLDKKSGYVVLEEAGRVPTRSLRNVSPYKDRRITKGGTNTVR